MRKLTLSLLAVAMAALSGCSSDQLVPDNTTDPNLDGRAEGFFKVGINLPTRAATSTRAWAEAEQLNDGDAQEYAVQNVLLLLFSGANENAATLQEVITLTDGTNQSVTDDPNQITTRYKYVAKITTPDAGNKLYALAVVNHGEVIESAATPNAVKVKGETLTTPTMAEINAKIAASASVSTSDFVYKDGANSYFFMTNAVLNKNEGGTTQPTADLQTLAPVDLSHIYKTQTEATSGVPATDIYVERGVAKVTLAEGTNYLKLQSITGTGVTVGTDASLEGWTLTNTNKSSYIIRKYDGTGIGLTSKATLTGSDSYRFVGGNPMEKNVLLYRTYWAQDPNYSTAATTNTFSQATDADYNTDTKYCFENTFNVANQTYKNTTCAVLKVKLTTGNDDFYTIGNDRNTIYALDKIKDKVLNCLKGQSAFNNWFKANGTGTLAGSAITVTFDKTTAGKLTVESITIPQANVKGANTDFTIDANTTDLTDVISVLNTQLISVERFVGGYSYYTIRIKHFGDDLTPWNNGEFEENYAPKEKDIEDIYPAGSDNRQDANYLGRYGLVRNNWYDLSIGKILKVGSATPPDFTSDDHPDDELDEVYIMAQINILSWAKRPQSWDLK